MGEGKRGWEMWERVEGLVWFFERVIRYSSLKVVNHEIFSETTA